MFPESGGVDLIRRANAAWRGLLRLFHLADRVDRNLRPAPMLARHLSPGSTTLTVTPWAGFVIEAALAFFLCTVVLSTAVAGRAGNFAPLAIGMTLTLNIIMGGPLTGAAFNPARALGPMVATGNFNDAWLYLAAPIVGAIIAALLHTGLARLIQERVAAATARTPAE